MIIASAKHETNENLRIMLLGKGDPPNLTCFYLQRRKARTEPWQTSRRLRPEELGKWAKRFGFDEVELMFELEDAAEKKQEERSF